MVKRDEAATVTPTPEREQARRISAYWDAHPHLSYEEAASVVDAQLAAEEAERAEAERHMASITGSLHALGTCSCCGVLPSLGSPVGLCDRCAPVVARVRAERLEAELVDGRSRRELAESFVARG